MLAIILIVGALITWFIVTGMMWESEKDADMLWMVVCILSGLTAAIVWPLALLGLLIFKLATMKVRKR